MASTKVAYASSGTITITLASLATSSTLVAGRSAAEIDNTSNLYLDYRISGKVTVGTGPTVATAIEVWMIPKREDSSYHDTFDGTDKNVTVTSRAHLLAYGTLLSTMNLPTNTSDVTYEFSRSLVSAYGAPPPAKFQIFVVHNTGVNLNSTGGNHALYQKALYSTTA